MSARIAPGAPRVHEPDSSTPPAQIALDSALAERRDRERRRRERLEPLLPAIAGALDVRQVFPGMSAVIQEVLPHDALSIALLTAERDGVTIHASINFEVSELARYRFSDENETIRPDWRYFLAYDLDPLNDGEDGVVRARVSPPEAASESWVELRPGPVWTRKLRELGLHSTLRVPIRAESETIGGLAFSSQHREAYSEDDIAIAARIADHVSLALAHERLAAEVRRASLAEERARQLESRIEALASELESRTSHRALGRSERWKRALAEAARVAGTETTVLLTGESGTGKEVLARLIHRGSRRSERPFVAVNCAALPEQLLESELFGHERGAFTGAHASRAGRIEQAAGGTLFLDEVGEMPATMQAKLLRVLQEREFQRVGGAKTLRADVRVIAATNREPRAAIARGELREDLYYRLSAFEIALPPLRDRRGDILLLAEAFLEEVGSAVGRPAAGISEDARDLLLAHRWPGNVRELRNAMERAVILCEGGLVAAEHLPIALVSERPLLPPVLASGIEEAREDRPLREVERALVERALAEAFGNRSLAARRLGIPRGQLYTMLRRHGLA